MNIVGRIVAASAADDTEVARRMGEMLWSAVRHGCLLDPKWWSPWLVGVQDAISVDGSILAVEMRSDGIHGKRRWFADPITKILIAKWHREGLRLANDIPPEVCFGLYMGPDAPADVDRFTWQVRAAWEFRLPGVMLAYARGTQPGAGLPINTWERIVYGKHRPVAPDKVSTSEKVRSASRQRGGYADERRALRPVKSYLAGRAKAMALKAEAIRALRQLPATSSPLRRALREWCVFALERERSGRVSLGYAPSTVERYLQALAVIFEDGSELSPLTAPVTDVEAHILQAISGLEGRTLIDSIKAVMSFVRFRCRELPDDQITIDLERYRIENHASPNVVIPGDYETVLRILDRAGETDLALLTILMFRAGVRIDEAIALRVGDVNLSMRHVELVIEAHEERSLKTKTSRRIIPLDVLLEPAERDRLTARVKERGAASGFGIEAWLFGHDVAMSPPSWKPIARRIEAVMQMATGMDGITVHHLRHSFASYLFATLLLPVEAGDDVVPPRLLPVISPGRRERVIDRLLGNGRLGGGALHAISQLMGHTGPNTTLRYYCHLLDMSLGIYCNRPSSLILVDPQRMQALTEVGSDARRKATARQSVASESREPGRHERPRSDDIRRWSPEMTRKLADAHLLASSFKRLARPLARALSAAMDEDVADRAVPDRNGKISSAPPRRGVRSASSYAIPWRAISAAVNGETKVDSDVSRQWREAAASIVSRSWRRNVALPLPKQPELRRFIDRRLCLTRRPHRKEVRALMEVVHRWRRGHMDIRLSRLADAQAFVELLGIMGFDRSEIVLSLTSMRGWRMSSEEVHCFLKDRSSARRLAGRSGWRGSMIVRLRPKGLAQPILSSQACRIALSLMAIHNRAGSPTLPLTIAE